MHKLLHLLRLLHMNGWTSEDLWFVFRQVSAPHLAAARRRSHALHADKDVDGGKSARSKGLPQSNKNKGDTGVVSEKQ